jgi:hypothetical protein
MKSAKLFESETSKSEPAGPFVGPATPGALSVGINQILPPATTVIGAASFYQGEILGKELRSESDALFANRERLRHRPPVGRSPLGSG